MFGSRCCVHRPSAWKCLAIGAAVIGCSVASSVQAGFVVSSASSETISFALWHTNGGSFGSPSFSSDPKYPKMLLSAGPLAAGTPAGTFPTTPYPGLASIKTQGNSYTLPTGTAAFSNSVSSDASLLDALTYGSSTVRGAVSTSLANKGSGINSVIGTSFNAGTFLNSGTDMLPATAAVTYASIHGEFLYSGSTLAARVGSILSASGYVTPGGFVELANVGTITVGTTSFNFSMIIAGAFDNASNFMQYSSGPVSFNYLGDGSFTVTGSYAAPSTISIPNGTKVTIDSYLTMIADPASGVILTPNGLSTEDLPDIVAGVGGPLGVPEPATVVQLGIGLLLASGVAVFRRRGRSIPTVWLTDNARRSLPGLLALCFSATVSGQAAAASVTINALGPIPEVQSGAFYSSSTQVTPTNQVNFVGKYLSTGIFPSPGSSVSYTVVFTEMVGGSTVNSDLTTITLMGLAVPDSHKNVQVSIHFEGIVTTSITPGPGVYFVSMPNGYFDIAAYLVSLGAHKVPQDLSVRVMSHPAVPEPASIASVAIGLVSVGLWTVRRRSRSA